MVSRPMTRQTVAAAWLDDLAPVLDRLAAEIRDQLGREPDAGDLLLALACAPATLPAQALAKLGVELDVLWGTIERVRQQTLRARERLTEQVWEVRAAKEQALEAQEFERAAGLRDQERELTEQAHARTGLPPEALQEIRRRLGIPEADDPPPPPELT